MSTHSTTSWLRRVAALAVGIGLAGVASFALVTDASAHANVVSGAAICDQVTGTYTITWTVANNYNVHETATLVSVSGGGTLTGLPASIPASPHTPYKTATLTQSGVPGTATAAALTVDGVWSDKYSQHDSAALTLGGDCVIPPRRTTAAAASFTDATCEVSTGSYTIPASTSATYTVAIGNWAPVAASAGTVAEPVGALISVTAHAKTGFVLTGTTVWTHTIAAATGCYSSPPPSDTPTPTPTQSSPPPVVRSVSVTPAPPTITQPACVAGAATSPSYSIPGITGVTYFANGVSVAAGDHHVAFGTSTIVTAAPLSGFTFPASTVTSWTLVAGPALTSCVSPPTAVLGIVITRPPTAPSVTAAPGAVLPFTGQPIVQTALVALGLLLTGGLLVGSSRRHRAAALPRADR